MAIDRLRCSGAFRNPQFCVIQIDSNDLGAAEGSSCDGPETHTSATEHRYRIPGCHAASSKRMKSIGQRFDEAKLLEAQIRRIQVLSGDGNILSQSAVSMYAQRFIELASIGPSPQARCALPTTCVRRERHVCAHGKRRPGSVSLYYGCGNLMPRDPRKSNEWILATVGVQVASAKPDHPHLEQNFLVRARRIRNCFDGRMAGLVKDERLHHSARPLLLIGLAAAIVVPPSGVKDENSPRTPSANLTSRKAACRNARENRSPVRL